jgi:hypothetical protein
MGPTEEETEPPGPLISKSVPQWLPPPNVFPSGCFFRSPSIPSSYQSSKSISEVPNNFPIYLKGTARLAVPNDLYLNMVIAVKFQFVSAASSNFQVTVTITLY